MNIYKGFVFVEFLLAISVVTLLGSVTFAGLSGARLDARDKERIQDLQELTSVLREYKEEHGNFPSEYMGANGDTAMNTVFRKIITPYVQTVPVDPAGYGDGTYYYYYDADHNCGGKSVAIIFARQMDNESNANFKEVLNTKCGGVLDSEGRGGGEESYNIIVGPSTD